MPKKTVALSKDPREYVGWPSGLYPMMDGWKPPTCPSAEALLNYEEQMASMTKAVLVKRHVCVLEPEFQKLSNKNFMDKNRYSMLAHKISEGFYSGVGSEQAYYVIVYYEPADKSKVERAWKSVGGPVFTDYEQIPVDPDSEYDWEVTFMYFHGQGKVKFTLSPYDYQVAEGQEAEDPWGPKDAEGPYYE